MSNYDWNKPTDEWNEWRRNDFLKWALEAHGEEPFKEMIAGYRAVMDIQQEPPEGNERYTFGWVDTRGVFGK